MSEKAKEKATYQTRSMVGLANATVLAFVLPYIFFNLWIEIITCLPRDWYFQQWWNSQNAFARLELIRLELGVDTDYSLIGKS